MSKASTTGSGVKGRVEQENWLGQAQILATGGETYYSRRVDRGMPVPDFVEPASLAPAAPRPAPRPPSRARCREHVDGAGPER